MAYRIEGLSPEPFRALFGLSDEALTERGALRVVANKPVGFPCRITLEDASPGETLILLNHVSQDAATPYRASHARAPKLPRSISTKLRRSSPAEPSACGVSTAAG